LHPFSDFDALPSGDGDITDRPRDFPTNFAPYLAHAMSPLLQPFVYLSSTCLLPLVYLPHPTSLQPADLNLPFDLSVNTATLQITQISPCINPYRSLFTTRCLFPSRLVVIPTVNFQLPTAYLPAFLTIRYWLFATLFATGYSLLPAG
jgi:hypothetical protein